MDGLGTCSTDGELSAPTDRGVDVLVMARVQEGRVLVAFTAACVDAPRVVGMSTLVAGGPADANVAVRMMGLEAGSVVST